MHKIPSTKSIYRSGTVILTALCWLVLLSLQAIAAEHMPGNNNTDTSSEQMPAEGGSGVPEGTDQTEQGSDNLTGEDDSNLMSDMDFETEDMTKQIDTDPLIVHLQGIVFTLIYFGGMFGAIYTAARLRMYRSISNELLIVLYALWPLLFIVWGGFMIYRRRRPA